jgi:pSer/pThr/pTyr-binding forkhead associated (FHA) protein
MELQDKAEIKIGRIPDCDIKLKDISVSRSHALIRVVKYEDNKYKLLLTDNNSKFGTLLYA